jgi:CrcB protein
MAVGGFLGTLGRYELTLAWPGPASGFPTATFVINTTGAFLIGLVLTVILERLGPTRYLRPFAVVGLLGGWTTMSSLAVEADVLIKQGHALTALGYLGATVVAGVIAAALGIALGRVRTGAGLKGGHA